MDGNFQGTYGIVSAIGNNTLNMLLGNGSKLANGAWKIEATEAAGSVLVIEREKGFLIDAQKPFKLTIPLEKGVKSMSLNFDDVNSNQVFIGKVIKNKKQKLVEFDLPVLNNAHLIITE